MKDGITQIEAEAYRFGTRNKQRRAPQVVVKKASIKKQAHGKLVDACIKWLFAHGVYCWPNRTGAYTTEYTRKDGTTATYRVPYGKTGSGDIIGVSANGIHVEVEAKVGDDEQRESQTDHEQRIKEKRGIYVVARSIEDLEQNLKPLLCPKAP